MANYCLSFSQLFFDNSSWNNNVQIFDWEIRQTSEIRGLWKRSARVFHFARDAAELSEVRRSRRKHPEDHYPTLCAFNPSRDHYHLFWQPCAGIGIRTFAENESAEFIITSSLLVPRFAIGIMASDDILWKLSESFDYTSNAMQFDRLSVSASKFSPIYDLSVAFCHFYSILLRGTQHFSLGYFILFFTIYRQVRPFGQTIKVFYVFAIR